MIRARSLLAWLRRALDLLAYATVGALALIVLVRILGGPLPPRSEARTPAGKESSGAVARPRSAPASREAPPGPRAVARPRSAPASREAPPGPRAVARPTARRAPPSPRAVARPRGAETGGAALDLESEHMASSSSTPERPTTLRELVDVLAHVSDSCMRSRLISIYVSAQRALEQSEPEDMTVDLLAEGRAALAEARAACDRRPSP